MPKFNSKAVLLVRLSEAELSDLNNFDCNDEEMNEFLRDEALLEQETGMNCTVLLYYYGELTAFCSICCDSIPLSRRERKDEDISAAYKVPSIKIARIGRSVKYKEYGFGRFLIDYVKDIAFELGTSRLGVRFLTLDAYPNRFEYYQSLGFIRNEALKTSPNGNISMRADIFEE